MRDQAIVITGAFGSLGAATARAAIKLGARVALIDRAPTAPAELIAKAGVHRLTESLAAELKNERITVNAVLPSIIDTPPNRKDMPNADFSTWVSTDSLANILLFLASEQAQDITGALLPVTGRV